MDAINPPARDDTSTLLRSIVDDLKTIARDEAALAKRELSRSMKAAAADVSGVVLAAIVALIGLGMLCTSAVVALDAVIESLAVRLLVMAAVYLVIGGVVATLLAKRLKRDIQPDLKTVEHEARSTLRNLKEAARHA